MGPHCNVDVMWTDIGHMDHCLIRPSFILSFAGLQNLLNPAIPDWRTWSKSGEREEHGEHGKDGKHQPDDSKVTRRLLREKSKLTFVYV